MLRLPNGHQDTSRVGVGCAYLTAGSPTRHDERLIRVAVDEGARHFDVAPQYGLGTAEAVLGRALASGGWRNQVTITTKYGISRPSVRPAVLFARSLLGPVRKLLRPALPAGPVVGRKIEYDPDRIENSLDESLRYLKTDHVDAFLLHMPEASDVNPQLIARLARMRDQGKSLAIGLATSREQTNLILQQWPGVFDIVQYSWSVLDRPLESAGEPFRITHRAIMRAFGPMSAWLAKDLAAAKRLSAATGLDLADAGNLSRALIGAALHANCDGITLIASRSITRTKQNIRDALAPETKAIGGRLIAALAAEENAPVLGGD